MLKNFIGKLAKSLVSYPKLFVTILLISAALAGLTCLKLSFDSSYEALLPENSPKLAMTDQVRNLTGGFRQLVLAIEGDSLGRLQFAGELSAEVAKIPEINRVELKQPVEFFKERAIWLLPTDELTRLNTLLTDAIEESAADPEGTDEDTVAAWAKVGTFFEQYRQMAGTGGGDYKNSRDGRYLFLTAIPSIKFSDMQAAIDLLQKIEVVIAKMEPEKRGLKVEMAGNLKIVEEQHQTMSRDLTNAAILSLVLAVLLVAFFTKKPKAPLLVGLALITGIGWTMAITALTIGHLNIITGFLVSVIVGLGIDFGIHIFIRYQQEKRQNDGDYRLAMEETVKGLFIPTGTAALTTVGTFFAFYFADFRGFSEFGLIAALGVALTFVASFLLLPPLLVLFDQKDIQKEKAGAVGTGPLLTKGRAAVALAFLGALSIFGYFSIKHIEFKNDYKNLRGKSAATAFLDYVDGEMGGSLSPTVFIFDSLEDSRRAAALMREEAKKQDQNGTARILKLLAASDFVPPADEAQKAAVTSLKELLDDPDLAASVKPDNPRAGQLQMAKKLLASQPWNFADLPESLRQRFATADGQKYLLYLWPHQRYEADYQAAAWEKILDGISSQLQTAGINHLLADETLILAWVYQLILQDSPFVIGLAALVTLLFLLIDFRSIKKTVLVALPLFVGMGMVFALMRLFGLSLNMFNIIVLPSIIGIGIDNAIHIYHRYEVMGKGSLDRVLRSVGIASFLASATTIIGFGSSLISHMPGLRSLGVLAIIGLSATFISAVIFFPSLLKVLEGK